MSSSGDPLRIDVELNTGAAASGLADLASNVANSVQSMAEQFLAGNLSAKEIAEAVSDFSAQLVDANPNITGQVAALESIKAALSEATAAYKESAAGLSAEGEQVGGTSGYMKNMATEAQAVAVTQQVLKEATKQVSETLAQNAGAASVTTAATKGQAAASAEGSAATAKSAATNKEAATALSAEGEAALQAGTAVVEGSESAQVASQRYLQLQKDIAALQVRLAESKSAFEQSAQGTAEADAAATKYAATLTALKIKQNESAIAEKELKTALSESYAQAATPVPAAARVAPPAAASAPAVTQQTKPSDADQAAVQQRVAATEALTAAEQKLATADQEMEVLDQKLAASTKVLTGEDSLSAQGSAAFTAAEQKQMAATVELEAAQAQYNAVMAQTAGAAANVGAAQASQIDSAIQLEAAEALGIDMNAELAESALLVAESDTQAASAASARASAESAGAEASTVSATAAREQSGALNENTAALSKNAAATGSAHDGYVRFAQQLLATGTPIKDIQSGLKTAGASAEEVAAVMKQLGLATEVASTKLTGFAAAAGGAGAGAEALVPKVDNITRNLAYSAIRMGSTEVGLGQLGFAFARLGSILPGVAELLAKSFPIFAVFALVEIVGLAINKLQEWADQEEKSAEESAKFSREVLKSGEAIDKMREKLADQASPLAGLAIQMANLRNRVVDLSKPIEDTNKQLEDSPGLWRNLEEHVGGTAREAFRAFDSSAQAVQHSTEDFNKSLSSQIQQAKDLPGVIDQINTKLKEMADAEENLKQYEGVTFDRSSEIAELERLQVREKGIRDTATNIVETQKLQELSIQQSIDEKLIAEQSRLKESRISLSESEAKSLVAMHLSTYQQEEAALLHYEDERRTAKLAEVAEEERILHAQEAIEKKLHPETNFGPAEAALGDKRKAIETDIQKAKEVISDATTEHLLANARRLTDAEISANEKVFQSYIRLSEAREKIAFQRADTPAQVEAAAIPLIRTTTESYQEQIKVIEARAVALQRTLLPKAGEVQVPVKLGIDPDAFDKIIEPIKVRAPEIAASLTAANAEVLAKQQELAGATLSINTETENKVREIHKEALNDYLSDLNVEIGEQREKYQSAATELEAVLSKQKGSHQAYYAAIEGMAESSYERKIAVLGKETEAVIDASNKNDLTQHEATRKLIAIYKEEETAYKEMKKREEEANKKAIEEEVAQQEKALNVISQSFNSAFDKIITTHTHLTAVMAHFWDEMVQGWARMGIQIVGDWARNMAAILIRALLTEVGITTIEKTQMGPREATQLAYQAFLNSLGIKTVSTTATHEAAQTAMLKTQIAQREAAEQSGISLDTQRQLQAQGVFLTQQTAKTTAVVVSQTAQKTAVATGINAQAAQELAAQGVFLSQQTAQVAAVAASQAAQTSATASGSAARTGIGFITSLKAIFGAAAASAAKAYEGVMETVPPPANLILAPVAAAGTFAAVLAFKAFLSGEGGIAGTSDMQPVLVHAGEVITHQKTLAALNSPASSTSIADSATSHAMKIEKNQISMLEPGQVVVPKGFAGDLTSIIAAKGGKISVAPGQLPPSDIHEIPQRLPSSMTSTIAGIVKQGRDVAAKTNFVRTATTTARSASEGYVLPAAAGGFVMHEIVSQPTPSAAGGFVVSASGGYVPIFASAAEGLSVGSAATSAFLPRNLPTLTSSARPGNITNINSPGGPTTGDTYHTTHNNFRIEMHNHGGKPMSQDDVTMAVKKALRNGSLP